MSASRSSGSPNTFLNFNACGVLADLAYSSPFISITSSFDQRRKDLVSRDHPVSSRMLRGIERLIGLT
jgi:hypothetical protein